MIVKRKPPNYWILERCKEDALNYNSRSEWWKNSGSAYERALKNGWSDECCSHMEYLGHKYSRLIYCAIFPKEPDGQRVYIGLTGNFNKRKTEHLNQKQSAIYKYIIKSELTPYFIKLTNYLPKEKAQIKEKEFQEIFIINKFIPLFSKKAGGLGGNSIIWTLERCKEDSLNYKTRREWWKNSGSAYNRAVKMHWLDECCSHMISRKKPPNYWTLERCKEDALNHNSRNEWRNNNQSAYSRARKNKWLDECCSHMYKKITKPIGYWTLERCKEDALNHNSRNEWKKSSGSAYKAARKNKWLDECCSHMN